METLAAVQGKYLAHSDKAHAYGSQEKRCNVCKTYSKQVALLKIAERWELAKS